ncbi:Ig domain-containing protein [Sinorhizobium psoraleae]|uniref:Ig domain-containing protein n=1 Tax=Sinorhizobium psoraleae TaxID=520838 RepID=A0ABT4KIM2_9HYPH|nr:Ig domain-containing protein [Sinorhizobium psoraleae]MCZ4091693.1 Ig domain-containing protein [Sinorhizobium psoraleae]
MRSAWSFPVLMISGTPVLTATLGEAYAGFTVSASGGTPPYTYPLVGDWPDGISVNPSTGAVSGTPTEMGSFTGLSVRVTDDIGNTADLPSFTLGVSTAGNVVAYANFQLPSATGNFSISTTDLGGRTPKMAIFCLSNAEVSETGHSVINERLPHLRRDRWHKPMGRDVLRGERVK